MGKSAAEIRREIEATREEMEETIDALGYKLDVKSRAKERIGGLKSKPKDAVMSLKDKVTGHAPDMSGVSESVGGAVGTVEDAVGTVGETVGGAPRWFGLQAKKASSVTAHKAQDLGHTAQQNPAALALGGIAVGLLVGLAAPKTSIEDEKLGETADHLKQSVKDTGASAIDRGKELAGNAVEAVSEQL